MAAPIPDAPSTIKNKGIIKMKKEKREVGFLYTNKQRALLQ
jgi:hypothetical protein